MKSTGEMTIKEAGRKGGLALLSKRGKMIVLDDQSQVIQQSTKKYTQRLLHFDDFIDAIHNHRRPTANVVEAFHSVVPIHLANVAVRTGRLTGQAR